MQTQTRRNFLMALAASSATPLLAQTDHDFVIGVADAVSYKAHSQIDAFFDKVGRDISKILKEKARIEKIPSYATLADGLVRSKRWDLLYIHPGHLAIRGLMTGNYSLAALSKSHLNYRTSFLLRGDSPVQRFEDLAGKRIITPDPDSITSWMTRAALRENTTVSAKMPSITTTRYQEAIRMAVENRLVDAGATASDADIKDWQNEGHRILRSPGRAVPIKHWLLNNRHANDLGKVRDYLTSLGEVSVLGAKEGFIGFSEPVLVELGKWLELGKA